MNIEPDGVSAQAGGPQLAVRDPPPAGNTKNESSKSDLQYVSIQLNGETFGGWYRVLPSGQMELLTLANMLCELRPERTPLEQARGMLTDFIRASRSKDL